MQFPPPGMTVQAQNQNGLSMRVTYDPRMDHRNPDPSPWKTEYGGRLGAKLFTAWQEIEG